MPDTSTVKRARRDLKEGKSPSTAASELVREEIDHVREGKHRARSSRQAIAIGLSKARRAGVPLKPPGDSQPKRTRHAARRDVEAGRKPGPRKATSRKRSQASTRALSNEGHAAGSHQALSAQARRGHRGKGRSSP